jgi:hypothetical protein
LIREKPFLSITLTPGIEKMCAGGSSMPMKKTRVPRYLVLEDHRKPSHRWLYMLSLTLMVIITIWVIRNLV